MNFMGYKRTNGQVGTRNLVAVIPLVFCANHVANRIAAAVRGVVAFPHPVGCGYPGMDQQLTAYMLNRIALHPNFGAVVLVGLGCERVRFEHLALAELRSQKPVHCCSIQEEGDSLRAIAAGIAVVQNFATQLSAQKREECSLADLVLGLKCGGTDAFSGLAANPALGLVSDRIIAAGGSSLLTEITELCGTEEIMARRAVTPEVGKKIKDCVKRNIQRLHRYTHGKGQNTDLNDLVSPGNADGGVSNVVEKALGGLRKAGSASFQNVLAYGEALTHRGLHLMDGPGHDGEAVTGLVASGATLIAFTTGRGTPVGFPGVPVVKITGNPALYTTMQADLDFDAGVLFREEKPLNDIGDDLMLAITACSSGKLTKAERLGHEELFCISRFIATHQCIDALGGC